jgi:hypothetical protein
MLFGILLDEVTPLSQEDSMEDCVLDLFFATSSKATHQSRKPWNVQLILLSNDELWMDAKKLGIYNSKKEDIPQPRLWQPDPLISDILWPILQTLLPKLNSQHCTIWDLGSGSGRDVCFLAEKIKSLRETKSECRIVGFDNHKASAQRSVPFWHRRHVSDFTEAKNLNLNKIDLIQQEMHNYHVICIYAVRFLNRKLFSFLASNSDLQAGTLFAASHFCKPHKDAIWPFDHPKVRHISVDFFPSIFHHTYLSGYRNQMSSSEVNFQTFFAVLIGKSYMKL